MWQRLVFVVVTLFFVAMNVLLFRSEILGESPVGSSVSLDLVWRKMLNAPDISTLEIRQQDVKVGMVRWLPSLYEAPVEFEMGDNNRPPEGMIRRVGGYSLEADGHYLITREEPLRFNIGLDIGTNFVWREAVVRLSLGPYRWELTARADTDLLRLRVRDDHGHREYTFRPSDLAHPERLEFLPQTDSPVGLLLKLALPALPAGAKTRSLSLREALNWKAERAWLDLGSVRLRGYQVQARLFDRYRVRLFINTVGEIVRVELPNGLVLLNDNLTRLAERRDHD